MDSTTATARDARHLHRALELAANGRGHTSPNPLVGAVVVRGDAVIGEGFHARAGEPHAERVALSACGEDPAGATMYVSLEPCAHTGRTPPCTSAILEAGITRVVVASDDPTDKASGRGLGILRDEGVTVDLVDGEVGHSARLLNQPFRKHARTGRPLVVFKSAMSLDGKVATASGDSQWISGESSRARAHRWRAECDAVAVGIGTARADDPLLTSRVEGAGRQPARVVFDSEAALTTERTARPQHRRGAGHPGLLARGQARAARPPPQRGCGRDHRLGRQRGRAPGRRAGPAGRARHPVDAARGRTAPGRASSCAAGTSTRRVCSWPRC